MTGPRCFLRIVLIRGAGVHHQPAGRAFPCLPDRTGASPEDAYLPLSSSLNSRRSPDKRQPPAADLGRSPPRVTAAALAPTDRAAAVARVAPGGDLCASCCPRAAAKRTRAPAGHAGDPKASYLTSPGARRSQSGLHRVSHPCRDTCPRRHDCP